MAPSSSMEVLLLINNQKSEMLTLTITVDQHFWSVRLFLVIQILG